MMIAKQEEAALEKKMQEVETAASKDTSKAEKDTPVAFYRHKDTLIEMVYDPEQETTALAAYKDGEIEYLQFVLINKKKLVPYSPNNNLLKHKVVLFPSRASEYGSEAELLKEIGSFIYRHVQLTPFFQGLAPYYVLLTWIYDCFNEVPYLRFIGDTGSGKTRSVETIGSLCYKPIFATGAASVSPIFRTLDLFRGTLLLDEADYRFSDEKAEIVKILNCGNTKSFPVLRSESSQQKEYNPVAFQVFGPKILDTRGYFKDVALENRCLTEEMGQRKLRDDIPINLPENFWKEALGIRNKLLMFRFRNYQQKKINPEMIDPSIEPRLNQIICPLASITSDPQVLEELKSSVREYNKQLVSDRGMEEPGQILEVIHHLNMPQREDDHPDIVSIQNILRLYTDKYGEKNDRGKPISAKWIGSIVRKELKLKTIRTSEGYIIPGNEQEKLNNLYRKYGLGTTKNEHNELYEHNIKDEKAPI